ncbi:ERV/ALR sulfhydryl oxidase domain-containing protein [Lyophyllum atratum]|nr:ERV/ALR sulfhydryl oxidase domain-containing protein [Lyophyllum atratum]
MISRFAKAFIAITAFLLLFTTIAFIHPQSLSYVDPWTGQLFGEGGVEKSLLRPTTDPSNPPSHDTYGTVIMPKLGNATAKAALGRATWKLMHTMTLRFPEHPTPDERSALTSYFHLTSRLYPCGECAEEFQTLLKKFPPQTASRRSASLWLCFLHNEVNKRLEKPNFDCAHLDAEYDCGCGDDPIKKDSALSDGAGPMDLEEDPSKDGITGVGMIKGGR